MKNSNRIISNQKQEKLINSFPEFLRSRKKSLVTAYGYSNAILIASVAEETYPKIVTITPVFNTPMYDAMIVLAGKLAALKKGMRTAGLSTEEFVRYNIEFTRSSTRKVPAFLRKLGGRIYLSHFISRYLAKVAKSVTANGWPTRFIRGTKNDDFTMSIETENCQMVAFFESIGEGDIRPYCTFFDFTTAEALGIGLKQVSTIETGMCKYCFYKKGTVEWPDSIRTIITPE